MPRLSRLGQQVSAHAVLRGQEALDAPIVQAGGDQDEGEVGETSGEQDEEPLHFQVARVELVAGLCATVPGESRSAQADVVGMEYVMCSRGPGVITAVTSVDNRKIESATLAVETARKRNGRDRKAPEKACKPGYRRRPESSVLSGSCA